MKKPIKDKLLKDLNLLVLVGFWLDIYEKVHVDFNFCFVKLYASNTLSFIGQE